MFVGDYICKVDSKGRMIVPSQFRKICKGMEVFILKRHMYDKALDLFPKNVWENEVVKLTAKLNLYNREHSALLREYYRGTAEVILDVNGRILLPKRIMHYAGIEKEVVVSGYGNHMMIWDKVIYESTEITQEEFEKLVLKELGNE